MGIERGVGLLVCLSLSLEESLFMFVPLCRWKLGVSIRREC